MTERSEQATSLGPGAEFDAIRALLARWGTRAAGIGDDAAIITPPRGDQIVVSVDSAVEHRHFEREWLSPRAIGYRAVTAALSDLAAMAAKPLGVLIALTVPLSWRGDLLALADGIADSVDGAQTRILGGNLADGAELTITTTVVGSAFTPLARNGARVGDIVYVTGRLGAPAAALARLRLGQPAGEFQDRFTNPVARIAEARWLAEHGATAAIDVSDGLVADVRHLAAASGVHIRLDAERIPLVPNVPLDRALESGEEFELVITATTPIDTDAFAAKFGVPLTAIGRVMDNHSAGVELRGDASGARVADMSGYDHFST